MRDPNVGRYLGESTVVTVKDVWHWEPLLVAVAWGIALGLLL